jgi:multidrug efflux pump subunit AcrB
MVISLTTTPMMCAYLLRTSDSKARPLYGWSERSSMGAVGYRAACTGCWIIPR